MPLPAQRGEFPPVSAALVDELERTFPDRCPDPALSESEIRQKIGEVRVVRFLRLHHERQTRADLGGRY